MVNVDADASGGEPVDTNMFIVDSKIFPALAELVSIKSWPIMSSTNGFGGLKGRPAAFLPLDVASWGKWSWRDR